MQWNNLDVSKDIIAKYSMEMIDTNVSLLQCNNYNNALKTLQC